MDLLESLNLSLPEQETRITTKISSALHSNPNIRLGFDSCCNCASPLKVSDGKYVCCKGCRRVRYCSKDCRYMDANVFINSSEAVEEEDHNTRGHVSVICALLRLCEIDEYVENPSKHSVKSRVGRSISQKEKEAAQDRISSEYESYPASLANTIMESPYFLSFMKKYARQKKRKRSLPSDADIEVERHDHSLTVHIIGASEEAELWSDLQIKLLVDGDCYDAYLDAFTELASSLKGIDTIHLIFVGPNCPSENQYIQRTIHMEENEMHNRDKTFTKSNSKKSRKHRDRKTTTIGNCDMIMESHCCYYDMDYLKHGPFHSTGSTKKKTRDLSPLKKSSESLKIPPKPDIIAFFNPGFTCPDYSWYEALSACRDNANDSRIPFLVTSNTEMEAISDLQYLYQHGFVDSLPPAVAEIVNDGIDDDSNDSVECSNSNMMFFGENPYAGSRVRQSGNMANDLFVKNRWIFGGMFCGSNADKTSLEGKMLNRSSDVIVHDDEDDGKKKETQSKNFFRKNQKKKNLALI